MWKLLRAWFSKVLFINDIQLQEWFTCIFLGPVYYYLFVTDVGSFESPMLFSPDVYNSLSKKDEVVDIDMLDDSNCAVTREYAKDIFIYLREAEVSMLAL